MLNHLNKKHRFHHETSVHRLVASGDDLGFGEVSSFLRQGDSHTVTRPGAGRDKPDVVKFGLFAKNFYGADLKSNTFRIDIVMSLKWKDPRVTQFVPPGIDRLVLSDSQAIDKIWIPDMVITNHELLGMQTISTSVEVFRNGEVEKVERSQVRISNSFELGGYPFDVQSFKVKIASAKYMANDLVLSPMSRNSRSSGINEEGFRGSYFVKEWELYVDEESDGDLVKSRGVMDITVNRNLAKYTQDHLVPTFIVLMISWAVFYFPFAAPFITPRLVLSIVTLLTFTNLMVKSAASLPGAAPFNWNDLFNQLIQTLMFVTIVINIFSEICYHQFKVENLARSVNHEAKILQPVLSSVCISFIMLSGSNGWMSLGVCALVTQFIVLVTLSSYVYWTMRRFRAEEAKLRNIEQQQRLKRRGSQEGVLAAGAAADAAGDADADCGDGGV
jgi:hypothetical protein